MPPGNSATIKRLQATEHADTLNSRQLTKKHGIFCSQTFLSTAINTHPGSFARSRICLFVWLSCCLRFLFLGIQNCVSIRQTAKPLLTFHAYSRLISSCLPKLAFATELCTCLLFLSSTKPVGTSRCCKGTKQNTTSPSTCGVFSLSLSLSSSPLSPSLQHCR
ncbi:hypothetical protein LZ32DRAFT_372614 [Colletotrichum eremochloae]|nr:hypothetical protein LZ32DRAFT_372614 [Colletotrichum eremochloae]